jgi:serine/threonine protein kinase
LFAVSSVLGAIVVILATVLIVKWYRISKLRKTGNSAEKRNLQLNSNKKDQDATIEMEPIERFLDEILSERPMRYSTDQIVQITNNFSTEVGKGGFGVVYKGKFPNGVDVAVKVLKGTINKRSEEQFMAEIGTVSRTYHMNLVKLYGFCFDRTTKALIYEFMENGSLDNFLFDNRRRLEWQKLHEIAIGTAKGIRYLHEECQQKIVHYDIKPANVLLTADFVPKVSDFGLAKYCARGSVKSSDSSNSSSTHHGSSGSNSSFKEFTGARGTPGYAAPEQWNTGQPVIYKCDVYSFGMLLFEILGRRRNLQLDIMAESQQWFPKWVWQKFEEGELEMILDECGIGDGEVRNKAVRMCKVAMWCVQYQPEARPTMSGVIRMLEGEMEIVPPINPFVYLSGSRNTSDTTPWSNWSLSLGGTTTGGYTTSKAGTDLTETREDHVETASPIEKDISYEISTQ